MIGIRAVRAWPGRHEDWALQLQDGACVADALAMLRQLAPAALEGIAGQAVYGVRVQPDARLRDGDRLELLTGLQADPKDARRRRAAASRGT